MSFKISLVGAGNIGGHLASLIVSQNLGNVVLFDILKDFAKGKALDINQSVSLGNSSSKIIATDNYEDIKDSDVVVITAGSVRKPGMSRDDLLEINSSIVKTVAENIKKYCSNAFVIVVTNPLDSMTWIVSEVTGFDKKKVVGMAGVLDSVRFSHFLSEEIGVLASDVNALILGSHGDSMVPILSKSSVAGIPLYDFVKFGMISQVKLDAIVERTKNAGAELVNLLKTGSAFFAPAASALSMIKAYLYGKNSILVCSSFLSSEYDESNVYIGVPVVIGASGVEKIIELDLSEAEKNQFKKSANSAKQMIEKIKSFL